MKMTHIVEADGKMYAESSDGKKIPLTGYPGQVKAAYMCAVDFQHEAGDAPTTGPLCRDLEALKAAKPCITQCGWVRVLLVAVEYGQDA